MSTHKHIDLICIIAVVVGLVLTVLFMNGEALGITVLHDEDTETNEDSQYFSKRDMDADWDTSAATVIVMNGSSGTITGSGAYFYRGDLVISEGGYYLISGTLDDGSIIVDSHKSNKIWICLNGVSVTASDDAAFRIDQADKVFLTLAEGSENVFTSGSELSEDAQEDDTNAAFYLHDDLTINGSGSLTIVGNYRHGINAKDDLVLAGGTITVTAVKDGIRVNDSFRIRETALTVECGDDALVQDNEGGYLYAESGTFALQSADDAVTAEGDILIDGGTWQITAGNDAIHSEADITVNGGEITVTSCVEGIEGANITVAGGEILIYASDDGFNASDGSGDGFSMARNTSRAAEDLPTITISGGSVTILIPNGTDADGLDSNGNIFITGGTIRISLNGNGSNNAIDFGSESGGICTISGGNVVACGSSSMAEEIDSSSTQCSVMLSVNGGDASEISVKDTQGNELLCYAAPSSFTSVIVSCPEMTLGETYVISVGGTESTVVLQSTVTTAGNGSGDINGGMMPDGGRNDGQMPDGEMPEMPDGEMPEGDRSSERDGHGRGGRSDNGRPDGGQMPGGGGRREGGEMPGGQMPDGEIPEMPDGEMPGMPDGEMPGMPDGEMPEMPDGEMPETLPDGENDAAVIPQNGQNQEKTETTTAQTEETSTIGTSGWWGALALTAAVLVLGLGFAILFRDRIK